MSESRPSERRGVLPPASGVLHGLLALVLIGCGGTEAGAPDDAASRAPASSGDGAGIDGSGADIVTQPSVEGNSLPYDGDDEATAESAASLVNVWQFSNRSMSTRFVHYHDPRMGPSGTAALMYGARDRAGRWIQLAWPYDGREVTYSYANLTVAPSYVSFRDDPAQREWRAVAGEVALVPLPDGRARVDFTGVEIVESFGVTEGSPEPVADGFVIGKVERICIEYVVPAESDAVPIDGDTGLPPPQPERDEDWSSPYCAPFAP